MRRIGLAVVLAFSVDWRKAPLFFLVLFMLTGCDVGRYEIKEDKSGRTIRLDKWTGEITIIAGDRLVTFRCRNDDGFRLGMRDGVSG